MSMRRFKKGVAGFLTGVCCMAMMSITAFANTDIEPDAGAYGVLKGELYGTRAKVTSVTSVTYNPDNAYLTAKLDAKNRQGDTLKTTGVRKSSTGILRYTFNCTNVESACYSVFGTQGVQGGTSQPAKAVYTYTAMD